MPLSMTTPIVRKDIQSIVPLKAGKVFLLRGFHRDEVVVKVEANVQGISVTTSQHIAKAIDKLAVARPLGPNEVLELQEYARTLVEAENFMSQIGGYKQDPNYPAIRMTCEAIQNPGGTLTKMEKLRVLDLDACLRQACEQHNSTALGKFICALSDPGGLEMIGEILVADLFMGNNDRFDFQYDEMVSKKFGNITLNFKRLINVGNVMIAIDPSLEGKGGKEGYRPVLLDYLDPGSMMMRKLAANPKIGLKELSAREWPGSKYLPDKNLRQKAAEEVAHDLLLCANPFGTNPGVFGYAEDMRVMSGMDSGARKILKHLSGRKLHPAMEEMYKLLIKQFK